ncbi:MAG: hypothetical protein GC159_01745 [Phycisphaera sp.]|nr:hypothetical protein [Phycisphaera sp.]
MQSLPPWARPDVAAKAVEPDVDPAELVPADARLYLRLDHLGPLLSRRTDDPLVAHAWKVVTSLQRPELWETTRERLGLSMDETINRYFGRSVVVTEMKLDGDWGVVVMSRASPDDLAVLPGAMNAVPWGVDGPGGGKVGPMRTFSVASDGADMLVAVGQRWLMMTETKHAAHLRHLVTSVAQHTLGLEGAVGPLARGEQFRATMAKLPPDAPIVMYTRNSDLTERHGLTLVDQADGSMDVHYAGQIKKLEEMVPHVEGVRGVDFGLLPAETITAVSINVLYHPRDKSEFGQDAEMGSKMAMGVLPDLAPPLILFLARVPPESVDPNPGVAVPVLGLAVKLKSPDGAAKLDSLIRSVHMILTLTEFNVVGTIFGVHREAAGDVSYAVADFGRALARRVKDPSLARLVNLPTTAGLQRLSFGRIGEWYVVSSQESFFRRCVDTYNDKSQRLDAAPDYAEFEFDDGASLLMSSITRAPKLAALLGEVHDYWQSVRVAEDAANRAGAQDDAKDATVKPTKRPYSVLPSEPDAPYSHIDKPLHWITDALKLRRSFSVQVWQDGDTGLIGHLHVQPGDHDAAAPPKQPTNP